MLFAAPTYDSVEYLYVYIALLATLNDGFTSLGGVRV